METEEADVAKIKDEAFKRAQSRSPTRQSPTSTSGTGNTPPQETSRDKRSRNLISIIYFMKKVLFRTHKSFHILKKISSLNVMRKKSK